MSSALQQHVKLRAASSATFAWSSFFSLRLLLRFNHSSLTNSFTSSSSSSANFQRSLLQAETLLPSSPLASRLPSTASSKLAISFISRNSQHYIKSMHSRKLKNSTFISDGWASCTNSYIIALWNSNHLSKAWAITLSEELFQMLKLSIYELHMYILLWKIIKIKLFFIFFNKSF